MAAPKKFLLLLYLCKADQKNPSQTGQFFNNGILSF